MAQDDLAVPAIEILIVAVVISFCIYILAKIIRLAFRWLLRWSVLNSGSSAPITLICFAIAVYLILRPLTFILSRGWDIAVALITVVPQSLQQLLAAIPGACAHSTPASCVNVVTNSVLSAWIALISSIILQLDIGKFPVVDAIMMTAIWLGLSNVFSNTNITQQLVFTVDAVRANFVNSYKAISQRRAPIFFSSLFWHWVHT